MVNSAEKMILFSLLPSRGWVEFTFSFCVYVAGFAQAHAGNEVRDPILKPSSPFSLALETLQKQIGQALSFSLSHRLCLVAEIRKEKKGI